MKIKDIKTEDRPREKLKEKGVKYLTDSELLAILLRCGNKNKSALELADDILKEKGSIKDLLDIKYEEIIKINGIKDSKAAILIASIELCRRAISYNSNDTQYKTADMFYNHLKPFLSNKKYENCYVIYLNSKLNIIKEEMYEIGGVRETFFPKDIIIRNSIIYGAYAVLISHNHPSGDPSPSHSDLNVTNDIRNALNFLGVILLDHIIIGNNKYYSFSNENLL